MPPDVGFRIAMFVRSAVVCATWERPPHPWTARQNVHAEPCHLGCLAHMHLYNFVSIAINYYVLVAVAAAVVVVVVAIKVVVVVVVVVVIV